jgi:hypothetical protein
MQVQRRHDRHVGSDHGAHRRINKPSASSASSSAIAPCSTRRTPSTGSAARIPARISPDSASNAARVTRPPGMTSPYVVGIRVIPRRRASPTTPPVDRPGPLEREELVAAHERAETGALEVVERRRLPLEGVRLLRDAARDDAHGARSSWLLCCCRGPNDRARCCAAVMHGSCSSSTKTVLAFPALVGPGGVTTPHTYADGSPTAMAGFGPRWELAWPTRLNSLGRPCS